MSELLTLPRLARRLGVTQQWLREQANAGNVPCLKAGTRLLFNLDAVEETLAERAGETRQGGSGELRLALSRDANHEAERIVHDHDAHRAEPEAAEDRQGVADAK